MAFIDIFNYKKYFKKSSDATVARVGHVNAVYDALQTDSQPKFTVGTVTQTVSNTTAVTINTTAGRIEMVDDLTNTVATFRVNNSEVTANSIVLITLVPNFTDSNKEMIGRISAITSGRFNISVELVVLQNHQQAFPYLLTS
jgi:hypothetical protein